MAVILHRGNREDGYILVDVLIAFFLVLISFSALFGALSNGLHRGVKMNRVYLDNLTVRNEEAISVKLTRNYE